MIKTPLSTMIGGAFWTPSATIIGGTSKTFNQLIKSLFANNEQGFFYDPNDLTTLYQDAAGTIPVTATGQPAGLVLDKSKGLALGEELFVNPTLTGQWVSDGNNVYTCTNSVGLSDLVINTGTANKFYTIEFEVIENSVAVVAYPFVGAPTTITTTGVFKYIRLATSSQFTLRVSVGRSAKVRLITAKELAGNHAYQTTSSMRPLLVASPQRLDFDIAEDNLITKLPMQLTDCTVIRSVPNVGTQVKYNQTLPMLYEDSTDHSGLVAINRALTRTEQLRLMDEFDKRAGATSLETLTFKIFDNNQEGFVYDPNDLATLYQDSAGTIPVTAAGQPVGLIKDKSGRNNHAYQTVSASRPILRQNAITGAYYLEFDGSDDFLVTNNIDFTSTDKVSLFAGVKKVSGGLRIITELSGSINSNIGTFQLVTVLSPEDGYASLSRGTSTVISSERAISFTYPAPDDAVLSTKHDISNNLSSIRRNGVVGEDSIDNQGSGNFGNYPLYIGIRGGASLPFNGHLYSLIGIGKLTSNSETTAIEKELAKRAGVTLSV